MLSASSVLTSADAAKSMVFLPAIFLMMRVKDWGLSPFSSSVPPASIMFLLSPW